MSENVQPTDAAVELPAAFSHLSPYVRWSLATETERNIMRHESSMDEIRAFVDVMLDEVDKIVAHLNQFDVNALPAPELALMRMLLSLAEVAPAVEFYNRQAVIDGYDARRFPAEEAFVLRPSV